MSRHWVHIECSASGSQSSIAPADPSVIRPSLSTAQLSVRLGVPHSPQCSFTDTTPLSPDELLIDMPLS